VRLAHVLSHQTISQDKRIYPATVDQIREQNGRGHVLTCKEFLQFVQANSSVQLTKGWIHRFFARHRDAIHVYRSRVQEDTELVIPRECLERHIGIMRELVEGKACEFVFNLDNVRSCN
jgi:hypothetical protein